MTRRRLAVLASGGGSNLQALLDYLKGLGERRSADVVLVASDRAAAGALDRARRHDIAAEALDARGRDAGLLPLLRRHAVDLVVLAGYLRFVPNETTAEFHGRIVNVHPALLPAFGGAGMYGERVHAAVLASGARVTGVTVHFVDEAYDRGPIIAQWPVPVHADDTVDALAQRVLAVEHVLYPAVIQQISAGAVRLTDHGRVEGWTPSVAAFAPADDSSRLRAALDPDAELSK